MRLGSLTLPGYREGFVRLLYTIIIIEFVVITVLLFGFSNEYLSNAYMRTWISARVPLLGILLHGELDALFVGVALGAIVILIQRRAQAAKSQEDPRRGVTPSSIGYSSTSLAQELTLQGDPISDTSPTRARAQDELPQDNDKELKKKS